MSAKEFELIRYLAAHRGEVLSRETLLRDVPEIVYCETRHRGFILLEIDQEAVQANYVAVSTVQSHDYERILLKRLRATRDGPGELSDISAV